MVKAALAPADNSLIRAQFSQAKLNGAHVLLLGFGKLNQALARELLELGCRVTAVSRTLKTGLKMSCVRQILGDLSDPVFMAKLAGLLKDDPPAAVVIAVTPDGRSMQHYQKTYLGIACSVSDLLAAHDCRVVQISSTGVFAQDSGEHITELSPPTLSSPKAQILYRTEALYRSALDGRLTVVRPSGIYGDDRRYLIRGAIKAEDLTANHWTNRIHERDLVAVVLYALSLERPEPVLLATDCAPVTKEVAVNWIRSVLGLLELTPDYAPASGKRLKSLKLPDALFAYPSYREGYGHAQLAPERAELTQASSSH